MRIAPQPFLHGILLGIALPLVVVMPALLAGLLEPFATYSRMYGLLPIFSLLAIPGYVMMRLLWDYYESVRRLRFPMGLLLGGWASGMLLLLASGAGRPLPNLLVYAFFGGGILCGFWPWIGALMSYAALQQRQRDEGSTDGRGDGPLGRFVT
jgi:hypothetical protein